MIASDPPDVIIQQSGGVIQNQTLELSCLAKGEPNVYNYQKWEHNWRGTDINSFNLQRQGPLIIIFSLQLQNSGNYTCSVDNGIKNRMGELLQHATVELLVKGKYTEPKKKRNLKICVFAGIINFANF